MNVMTVITAKGTKTIKHFTIDIENDIRVHARVADAAMVANDEPLAQPQVLQVSGEMARPTD
jgi:hypothetical protein